MSHTAVIRLCLFASCFAGVACGSTHETPTADASIADASARDGSAMDSSTVDAGEPGDADMRVCALSPPTVGNACSSEGTLCAYGEDPRWQCRDRFRCTLGVWTAEAALADCDALPPETCPASRELASGTACSTEGAICNYDGLACACTRCPNPYPLCMPLDAPIWACEAPNANDSCPAAIPNAGSECTTESLECHYGCEDAHDRVCVGGIWIEASSAGGCPVSTRRAKHDIAYLSTAEVDALAQEALQMPLATYEYNDPALAGRRRLGFIIEDAPMSYAVDPERSQVDLYGYVSVLLATTQSQARRIEALEQEVRVLTRRGRRANVARP